MWKGHGRKIKLGLRSTKQALPDELKTPPTGKPRQVEHELHVKTYNLQEDLDRKQYSDQTGKFPITSHKGNQYVMVAYGMDLSGRILAEPMRNRTPGSMIQAYQRLYNRL